MSLLGPGAYLFMHAVSLLVLMIVVRVWIMVSLYAQLTIRPRGQMDYESIAHEADICRLFRYTKYYVVISE